MSEKFNKYWYYETEEEKILGVLKDASDTSAGSDELKAYIDSWSTEYQFSPERQVLLQPFAQFFKDKDVLEIGAGMGAITRLLGENAKSVCAVEPSEIRARANQERCRDLSNVEVVNKELGSANLNRTFDVIVVVGVLEYAGKMNECKEDPYPEKAFIQMLGEYLKDDGVLIIAIENKLSTKYFLPNKEDHTGRFGESLHDFPNSTGIKTFSHNELSDLVSEMGYDKQKFFYPFPDYKTPHAVVSSKGIHHKNDLSHFLFKRYSQEYGRDKFRFLDEYVLLSNFYRNNIADSFANSFLVFCSKSEKSIDQIDDNWLIKRYNTGRKKEYRSQITLHTDNTVSKEYSDVNFAGEKTKLITSAPYIFSFIRSAQKDSFKEEWLTLFRRFYDFVISQNITQYGPLHLELHINNLIEKEGELHWFDKETPISDTLLTGISQTDIILRSALSLFNFMGEYLHRIYEGKAVKEAVLDFIQQSTGIDTISDTDIENFIQKESQYLHLLDGIDPEKVSISLSNQLQKQIKNRIHLLDFVNEHGLENIIDTFPRIEKVSEENHNLHVLIDSLNQQLHSSQIREMETTKQIENLLNSKTYRIGNKIRRIYQILTFKGKN